MQVLVTGHAGYIGPIVTRVLIEAGHAVTGLDTYFYLGGSLGPVPEPDRTIAADIRDTIVEQLAGFDAVVHLAALSNDPLGDLNPDLTFDINHRATVDLARNAKSAGIERFVFMSSCSLYGASGGNLVDESASMAPITPYGVSKARSEADLTALADETFSPTFLRCATAYGASPGLRIDVVVNNLTAHAYSTGKVLIKSDGTPWRPLVHIEDIARAVQAVLAAPRDVIHAESLNVGRDGENYQIRDVAGMVADITGAEVAYAPGGEPDARDYQVDFGKIHDLFSDYTPRWSVADGIRQLVEAYSDHSLSENDFAGSRFIRLARLEEQIRRGSLDSDLRWLK